MCPPACTVGFIQAVYSTVIVVSIASVCAGLNAGIVAATGTTPHAVPPQVVLIYAKRLCRHYTIPCDRLYPTDNIERPLLLYYRVPGMVGHSPNFVSDFDHPFFFVQVAEVGKSVTGRSVR